MRYYIISGEASGDLHGSNLMAALKKKDPDAQFRCWGGDLMQAQGGEIIKHYRDLAFMGLVEVVANIRTIKKNFKFCHEDLKSWKPDVLILVDYPGFNLRVAKFAKSIGLKVFYYISPTVWAWHKSRMYQIRDYTDRLYAILPFEKDFYKGYGIDVDFAGHPLLDAIAAYKPTHSDVAEFRAAHGLADKPLIGLLPGSRVQEVKKKLPMMLKIAEKYPQFQFVIAGAPSLSPEFYNSIATSANVPVLRNVTYDILNWSHAALVTSGTATLETALFEVPQVVCYMTSPVTFFLAKRLVSVKYIALANLILGREALPELVQNDLNLPRLEKEFAAIIDGGSKRSQQLADYKELKALLGGPGASERIASMMFERLTAGKV